MARIKKVAAVVTEYRRWSHAELLLGKILEGYLHDGGVKPDLHLAGLYVDQFPAGDRSRELARRYGFAVHDSVAAALRLGTMDLAVDGVMLIGEHGKYPANALG